MSSLRQVLLPCVEKNERTVRYQGAMDAYLTQLREQWDPRRGLVGSRGLALPHETVPGYWELPTAERAAVTSPEAARIYSQSAGRAGTAPLAVAAFAWRSHLSRYHRDPELLAFFQNGLDLFTGATTGSGAPGMYGLNGETWAHGWDMEGLVYGLLCCEEALDPAVRERALGRLRRSAQWFLGLGPNGNFGNQGAVQALGLHLYGALLEMPELNALSDRYWEEMADKVLDPSGQVIENEGPCMHYSYTAFFYAWLNAFLRGGERAERIAHCLDWFRRRHTESLYPLAGASSRMYGETLGTAVDLIPACEQVAADNPLFAGFADRLWERVGARGCVGHGASPWLWAILAHAAAAARRGNPIPHGMQVLPSPPAPPTPTPAQAAAWHGPHEFFYDMKKSGGRPEYGAKAPIKYLLVRRQYQTHYNFRDFLPFSGIQTWALGDEPPIIHPTPLAPSTTIALGLDTARQGVSFNWACRGAGCSWMDAWVKRAESPEELLLLVARYDRLWRLVFFADRSTVLLEFGMQGPRKTSWTLNRVEPAEARIHPGVVAFDGRRGRIHATVETPVPRTMGPGEWTEGVRVLEYDCGEGPAAFALSDDSFRFAGGDPLADGIFRFADADGAYEVVLSEEFRREPDPGTLSLDPWRLAHDTIARRV